MWLLRAPACWRAEEPHARSKNRLQAQPLRHQALPDGMDEIRVRRAEAGGPHIGRDLTAVIGGMQDHMHQNVQGLTGKAFALAVLVAHRTSQVVLLEGRKVSRP